MLSIEVHDRASGNVLSYLVLNHDQSRARTTRRCLTAAHFRSSAGAAVVRERFQPLFDDLLVVKECCCPVGLHDGARVATS